MPSAAPAVLFGLVVAIFPMSESQTGTAKFPSCEAFLKRYSAGVAKDAKTARQAVTLGMRRPAVNKGVYEANKGRLDRDQDGVACEQTA
jgi:hypothetical protein